MSNQQKLLDKILIRKAVLKEYEKATDILTAQLQQAMEQEGAMEVAGTNGGAAKISSTSSVSMPPTPAEVLAQFDARTMAALLAGTTVNAAKQTFLGRAFEGRDFGTVLRTSRSQRFSVSLPRTQEQGSFMRTAIQADMEELEKKAASLLEAYHATEGQAVLPDNPAIDEALEEKPKKAARRKATKK